MPPVYVIRGKWLLFVSYFSPEILQHSHGTRAILFGRSLLPEPPRRNQLLDHVLGVLGRHGGSLTLLWKYPKSVGKVKQETESEMQMVRVNVKWSTGSSSRRVRQLLGTGCWSYAVYILSCWHSDSLSGFGLVHGDGEPLSHSLLQRMNQESSNTTMP